MGSFARIDEMSGAITEPGTVPPNESVDTTGLVPKPKESPMLNLLDRLVHPPVRYSNSGYRHQLRRVLARAIRGTRTRTYLALTTHLALVLAISLAFAPLCAVARLCGFRFISIDLSQIGSILWLDLFLEENATTAKRPRWMLFVTRSVYRDPNKYAFDLYDQHLTFVSSVWLKLILNPFFTNPFSRRMSFAST